jgi:hypothetical protein
MQRHFSNRGEALPEITAARMLAGRKTSAHSAFTTRVGRRSKPEQWFVQPAGIPNFPKRKPQQRGEDTTLVL